MKSIVIAILAATVSLASAACPNLCSGNGNCGASDICTCYANWQGADCSERVCPYGLAWVDAPTGSSSAHTYAECSNKGICDRSTGLCQCYEGYEGKGCARSTCPNDCSGHGTCYFIEQISNLNSKFVVDYSNSKYNVYNQWDRSKIQACVCDPYYEGTDCSLRSCPRGDNVLTTGDNPSKQQICFADTTSSLSPAGSFTITYTDLYGGVWTTRPVFTAGMATDNTADSVTAANIQAALMALPNQVIPSVVVTGTTTAPGSGNGVCYVVTFTDAANSGTQNLLKINISGCTRAGCSPKYDGMKSGQGTGTEGGVAALVTSTSSGTVKESAVCSNHGLCDSATGLCQCFSGFYGLSCSDQTVLV